MALLPLVPAAALSQVLSLSFDDGLDPRQEPRAVAWNRQMLQSLDDAHLHAIVFPAGRKVGSPEGEALIADWSAHGHAVGNHTYSHTGLGSHGQTPAQFEEDVLRNERLFSGLAGWRKLLRFPYLKEGQTAEARDAVRAWMKAQGYRAAPVSIDASDWYYNERYLALSVADTGRIAKLRDLYLAHLWDRANYYDGLAVSLIHRRPQHVLLLHTNALNARFLPDVIAMFRSRGWAIVDPLQAFADPLYSMAPSNLPAGESIVWALAKAANLPGLRYPGEDDVYEKPLLDKAGV
jgi:peptidoglycan/xylan/chitin deacetylase (PgdA/CDA1 family)